MRRFGFIVALALGLLLTRANAGTYTLTDGTRISGEPSLYQEDGVVLKQADETYLPMVPWSRFTDDALKQLMADAKTPREKALVEPLLEDLASDKAKFREITVRPIQSPDRPGGHLGLLALFASPLGWFLLLVLYAANLFAAYEVALFRNQPLQTVCGLAAIPLFGVASPIYFLAMPSRERPEAESSSASAAAWEPATLTPASRAPAMHSPEEVARGAPPFDAATRAAAPEPPPADLPAPVVFQRGDFSFNRRFFETKLAGFFRVVLSDADKDMVIFIKASRGEFVGKRITRVTPTELYLEIFKENATADEMIPFMEILEVQVRHKDLV